jgi:glutamate-1-semialdehyde 2,1-aminomutase
MGVTSSHLFAEAQSILVGGVDSPVRAFKSVGGSPIFIKEGKGAYLLSEEEKVYLDYVLSWGPMILGHADPDVTNAISKRAEKGTAFGAPSALETQLAQWIQLFLPSMQKIRFVNSGTEATMSAIRAARGFTKRNLVVKFTGCYHGHVDSLLVSAGSGVLTLGNPDSAGVPQEFVSQTAVVDYNDIQSISDLFHFKGDQIAAVIVEPVAGNMGVVLPEPDFLKTLRQLCTRYQAVLIFDEVMTGFRVHPGGAQGLFGIEPDLTCLGKVIGGGLPCGAYGGKAEIMNGVSPEGNVYQAGTFSGNPLTMAAGIATLQKLKEEHGIQRAIEKTTTLVEGLRDILRHKKKPYAVQNCGTMFSVFFTQGPVKNLKDTKNVDTMAFSGYYHHMLDHGIYMAPSAFESNFVSTCHQEREITKTLAAFEKSILT